MKRRQQVPRVLVGLRSVAEIRAARNGTGLTLGAGMTLTEVARDCRIRHAYAALWQAVAQIATPHLRNMGTLGGNLCLDTRCNYYDQSLEWRKSIDFCMKKDGKTCWVAVSSPKCLAVSSTDSAPALAALGARVRLVSAEGERALPALDLFRNDGIDYLTRRPGEVLAEVILDAPGGWRSTYWKLRRRGSFDFPVLSVAAAARFGDRGVVEEARIVLGAVASAPLLAEAAGAALVGRRLDDAAIDEAAARAFDVAKPMDNTDFALHWRKRVTREFVGYALRELRGDDMRETRLRTARQLLPGT
jgi:4-hydroxybenzoyl-CoA reductase subunit beta